MNTQKPRKPSVPPELIQTLTADEQRTLVYDALVAQDGQTIVEITERLGGKYNCWLVVNNMVKELEKRGLVKPGPLRKCSVTWWLKAVVS